MTYPSMTPHHQPEIWKNRSPVRSDAIQYLFCWRKRIFNLPACQALKQQTIAERIQGGAANNSVTVVEYPSVCVRLHEMAMFSHYHISYPPTHVGKKLTKLNPRSCAVLSRANIQTRISLTARIRPCNTLIANSTIRPRKMLEMEGARVIRVILVRLPSVVCKSCLGQSAFVG